MSFTQLRAVLAGMLWVAALVVACSKTKAEEATIPGPQLGESTAAGPSNPSVVPPDAAGATGVSASMSTPPGTAPVTTARGPDTAAEGANSGTTAAPTTPTESLPQDTTTTLPQDRTAPPPEPQPNVFSPPPKPEPTPAPTR